MTADKIFEELGYEKSMCEDGNSEEFINKEKIEILTFIMNLKK